MTRKDYVKFAAMFKNQKAYGVNAQAADSIALRMAVILAEDNPNFDRDRFLTACGVES